MTEQQTTIPSLSIESQELIRALGKAAVGDVISYETLSQTAMGDVQQQKRGVLNTARRRLLHDSNMVFEVIFNVGLKRLNDDEIVATSEAGVVRINRMAKKGMRKLTCVDFDGLGNEGRVQHNARMSILGMLYQTTRPHQVKRIESIVEKANSRLELKETLDSFRS